MKLSCDGKAVKGTPTLMPLQHTFIFKPSEALLAGAKCKLDLSGVRDRQGQIVSAPGGGAVMDFTTAGEGSKPVTNPGSKFPHKTDGIFTDLVVGEDGKVTNEGEWSDVTPAKGMYTYFYADFDGQHLWLMNDWFYGGENIEPDCYNQFHVWTGGGTEWWDVRAFGDQHVEVRKNGVLIDPESDGVEGGASYTPSPNQAEPHTMYEIRVPASPGAWGVQLHDPGPTFNCHVIEQEPHPMQGALIADGEGDEGSTTTTIDISEPVAPEDVTLFAPFDEMVVNPPVKLVWQTREGLDFTIYQVQIATDKSFTTKSRVLDVGTYSASFDVPSGLLKAGETYYWHVIAWNTAGSTTSATRSFTVFGEEPDEPGPDGGAGGGGGSDAGTIDSEWAYGFTNANPHQLAVDKATGDIVVVGTFYQPINFGTGTLTPVYEDNETGFIVKFDKTGKALWSKQFGEAWPFDAVVRVAIDQGGDVIVAGTFEGTVDLGGGEFTSAGNYDVFVARYTAAGAHIWSKPFGGVSIDQLGAIAVGATGQIVMTGWFGGTVSYGGSDLVSAGYVDAFVVQLDAEGSHVWSKRLGGADTDRGLVVAIGSNGDVILGGQYKGTMDCVEESVAGHVGFVVALDSEQECRWGLSMVTYPSHVASLAVTSTNDIFVGSYSAGVKKIPPAGDIAWGQSVYANSIAVNETGNVAFIGEAYNEGTGYKAATLLGLFDGDGDSLAERVVVGGSSSAGSSVAFAPDGAQIAVGTYSSGIDFGNGPLAGSGMYLAKLRIAP